MENLKYNFLDDNFTTFENVESPKVSIQMPLMDSPVDISNWSTGVTKQGIPIVKNNTKSKMTVNNNEEVAIRPTTTETPVKRISKKEQQENAVYIMNNLVNRGFKPHEAAGIVGNLMAESSLNTGSLNSNDLGLPAGGLAGWRGSNFSRLKQFANSQGKSWTDIDSQLDFLTSSINNDIRDRLSKATNPHEASEAWAYYERYAGYDGTTKTAKKAGWSQDRVNKEHKNRSNYANEIYELWKTQKAQS